MAEGAVVERILQLHLKPDVTNLAPGLPGWSIPETAMPSLAEPSNNTYGSCQGDPVLLAALRTKLQLQNGVDMRERECMVTSGANQACAYC